MDDASVKVAVRIRPLTQKEQQSKCNEVINVLAGPQPQIILDSTRAFAYDYCLPTTATQQEVFDFSVRPLLAKFYEGYNATILAYGQTSSGKTFTLGTAMDSTLDVPELIGVVPRAVEAIFMFIASKKDKIKFQLSVSFLELYNEELIDLLSPHNTVTRSKTHLQIREDGQGGIYWAGVREESVTSQQEVFGCLSKGSLCRKTGSTDMNLTSSRSHAIFSISMQQDYIQNDDQQQPKRLNSKFHFVDLAGSERLKKTKATGDRAKEGISINSGLLAMGKVIHALNDGSGHIPYRDSKLTRLLQDSLGGNSQTLMIACVSAADSNFGETLNTLNYASRARNIKNRVMVNQDYQAMEVHQLRAEIARLKIELLANKAPQSTLNASYLENATSLSLVQLKKENDLLQSECRSLEMQSLQAQQSINKLRDENAKIKIERDSLLVSTQSQDGDVELHPVVVHYQETLVEMQKRIDKLELQANSTRFPRSNYGSTVSLNVDSGSSKISETIDKAKKAIQAELRLISDSRNDVHCFPVESKALLPEIGPDMDISSGYVDESDSESNIVDAYVNTDTEDKMLNMLDQIETDISIKEELVTQLESTQKEFMVMRDTYQDKIQQLHDTMIAIQNERDEALKKPDIAQEKSQYVIVKQRYEDKIKKLSLEIGEYRKKHQDAQHQLFKRKEQNENVIRNLKNSLQSMKQDKLRMMKRIQQREATTRDKEQEKEREINRLKRREKQMTEQTKKLEQSNHMQKLLLKKRTEESIQLQGKFRNFVAKNARLSPILTKKFWSPKRKSSNSGSQRHRSPSQSSLAYSRKSWKALLGIEQQDSDNIVQVQTTFKKSLLDNHIEKYISGRQENEVIDQLLTKRDALVRERRTLEVERQQLVQDASSPTSTEILFTEEAQQSKLELDNRMDIIDAEIKYLSTRIRSAQMESLNHSEEVETVEGNYQSAIKLVKDMDSQEVQRLIQLVLEDLVALKLTERTRLMEIQNLEKNESNLKRTINALRQTALDSTLKNELSSLPSQPLKSIDNDLEADFQSIDAILGAATPLKRPERRRSWTTQSPMVGQQQPQFGVGVLPSQITKLNRNVFERLHREQTIASQAKINSAVAVNNQDEL